MSYGFDMGFVNMSKDKMFDFCLKFVNECVVNAKEFLEEEKHYIPSERLCISSESRIREQIDRAWLYHVFRLSFVYWEEKELLAIVGCSYPESAKKMFTMFHNFQNSCDQDYDYNSWKGILYFESIVNKTKVMSKKELEKEFGCSIKDIKYYRKSFIYKKIYEELDLNNWLYGKEGNFKRFCLSGIDTQEQYFEMCRILDVIKEKL